MTKYLLKIIKYILLSSKDWARVRLLSYRDVYVHSTSIIWENIDIVLSIKLALRLQIQLQQRLTVKELPMMRVFWAFAKKPDLGC